MGVHRSGTVLGFLEQEQEGETPHETPPDHMEDVTERHHRGLKIDAPVDHRESLLVSGRGREARRPECLLHQPDPR